MKKSLWILRRVVEITRVVPRLSRALHRRCHLRQTHAMSPYCRIEDVVGAFHKILEQFAEMETHIVHVAVLVQDFRRRGVDFGEFLILLNEGAPRRRYFLPEGAQFHAHRVLSAVENCSCRRNERQIRPVDR